MAFLFAAKLFPKMQNILWKLNMSSVLEIGLKMMITSFLPTVRLKEGFSGFQYLTSQPFCFDYYVVYPR